MAGLTGKVAFVTGAAKGIGYACALSLGRAGAKVLLTDVDAAALATAENSLRAEGVETASVTCDVGNKASVDAAIDTCVSRFGRLDVAVANAGIVRSADFLDMSEADFDDVIKVNLKGVFLTGQAAARAMVSQGGGGAIVNMSSVNGITAIPNIASYNASKGGINNLTRAMALSLAGHGIRVNAVAPGSVMTDMLKVLP
jgi:NAD(P)-dependent dehydrogenase (short-subunit alcohol dehydrogenase family)